MKTVRMIGMAVVAIVLSMSFAACSDDDDDDDEIGQNIGQNGSIVVSATNVFTGALPSNVDGTSITYNSEGQATRMISDEGDVISFTYGSNLTGRATNAGNTVTMIFGNSFTMYMEVGNNGFVTYCEELYSDGDTDYWWFGYNEDGQLNYMKRSEGYNDVTNITYTNGNITKVTAVIDEEDDYESNSRVISYTSDKEPAMIENKGCLMMFDETFGIDMDEMKYAYFAGLLGKPTKNLPVACTETSTENGKTYGDSEWTYTWTLDTDGYPVKLRSTYSWHADWAEYIYIFEWVK